jgi:acetyltransferase-like isoleucine patch superfamily enzyme
MTLIRRVLTPILPRRWPDLLGKVLPKPRRRLLLWRLRYLGWRFHAPIEVSIHPSVYIGRRINIEIKPWTPSRLTIGANSSIGDDVRLRLRGGSIDLGESVDVRPNVVLNIGGGSLVMEGFNNLGWGTVVHCAESVHLSKFMHAGEYVTIVDSSHFYTEPDEWSYLNSRTAPIVLEQDVWLCPRSTITSGVTIGDHTIVASNTVVVKDTPGGVLVSGVPAKVVRELDQPWRHARDAS